MMANEKESSLGGAGEYIQGKLFWLTSAMNTGSGLRWHVVKINSSTK
jgi:hypothetical protein